MSKKTKDQDEKVYDYLALAKQYTGTFKGLKAIFVQEEEEKYLLLCPHQNLEPDEIKYDLSKLKKEQHYEVDILINPEGGYECLSLKEVDKPSKAELTEIGQTVVNKVFDELVAKHEDELKKKDNSFKVKNAIPPIPVNLFIEEKVWNIACTSIVLNKYPILLGPKGCGKTECAKQLAIAMDMNYFTFNMGAATKPKQMFCGMLQAENGSTKFIESEFLTAFQAEKPTLIFLDEATRTPSAAVNYLMTILDCNQGYIYIEELGKRVQIGKGVRFVLAGNVGAQYTDTRTIDGAMWDRLIKVPIDYLTEEKELELINQRAKQVNQKDIKKLIKYANVCRDAEKSGDLSSGISTRQLIDMSHYLETGVSLEHVFEIVFLNNFINGNINEVEQVQNLCQTI